MKRFIFFVLGFAFCSTLIGNIQSPIFNNQSDDIAVFNRFLQYSQNSDGSLIHAARFFMDTPYVGGTLEGDDEERLRVNLRELDCVTFVETALALHLMLKSDRRTFDNYCSILQNIRYRNGVIDGYKSRLHYFSDWIYDNCINGIVSLPDMPNCINFKPDVSYMSTRCDAYPALKADPELCKQMEEIEKRVNELNFCYVPKENVKNMEASIKDGDIIAITTRTSGLDITHVGFAVSINGRICLLHASSDAKKVVGYEILHDYLAQRRNHSGIIIVRVKNYD